MTDRPDNGTMQREPEGSPDYSIRLTYSYLVGVYLAVNAIRDVYLLVEGPECVHVKTLFIQGNHDWLSTLTSVSGHHRVANTALHPVHVVKSREDALRETLTRMANHEHVPAVMLTSMPLAFITGADYERLCGEVNEATGKPLIHVPGKSLSGDWLDGYAETLLSLARQLDLPNGKADSRKVAIVGHLYDRNEGDHRANTQSLREMLAALDLDTVSIWLEGQDFADLSSVGDAGTILSFPYGRKAAKWIARRTGARLVECDLPFGLEATERWIRQLGSELDRKQQAEALIDRMLQEVVPSLEWVIPFVFQNRNWGYIGDPYLLRGYDEIARTVGARLDFACITNPKRHLKGLDDELLDRTEFLAWPRRKEMLRFVGSRIDEHQVSVLVTNNAGVGIASEARIATVEFGFPSYYHHQLSPGPFLGFRGFLAFIDRVANAARRQEIAFHRSRMEEP